jgi:CRP/FNR family cyclic AMP-dependent transcriptional regulator
MEEGQMDLEGVLATVPLFAGLEKKDLRSLARSMKVVDFPAGHVLIQQGSGGFGGMGIVLSGSCSVVVGDKVVDRIGPGQVFGEMSLIDDRPRSASVITEEPTRAAELSTWDFRARIKENPEIAINLLRTLSERLRAAHKGSPDL